MPAIFELIFNKRIITTEESINEQLKGIYEDLSNEIIV